MKFTLLLLFLCTIIIVPLEINAQNKKPAIAVDLNRKGDSLKQAAIEYAALLDPQLRQFTMTFNNLFYSTVQGKTKDGQELYEGKLSMPQVKMNMNVPIIQKKGSNLVLSIGYIHQFFNTKEMEWHTSQSSISDTDNYMPTASLGLSYSSEFKAFGRNLYGVLSANGIFNAPMSSYQFTFTGIIMTPLIKKTYTNLSLGAVAMWNPASPAPFFLFFSYYHKFQPINTELMIGFPYDIAVRKELSSRTSLSLRGDLVGNNILFQLKNSLPNVPANLTYSTLDIRSGLLLEYRLTKKLIFSAGGGVNSNLKSRVLENNKESSDYIVNNKYKATPYFQVGISLLPFWKGLGL